MEINNNVVIVVVMVVVKSLHRKNVADHVNIKDLCFVRAGMSSPPTRSYMKVALESRGYRSIKQIKFKTSFLVPTITNKNNKRKTLANKNIKNRVDLYI